MGIYPQTPWARDIQTQAYKFWFWGLALSVLGGIWSLLFSSGTSAQSKKNEKATPPSTTASKTLMKRVIVDGCDLMIPGSSLGWISMGSEIVGMLMVLSTVVSMGDVWRRANGLG